MPGFQAIRRRIGAVTTIRFEPIPLGWFSGA
jgi:hypothetical protein